MRADKIRILPYQSLQGNDCQIRTSAFCIDKRLVVLLDRLVHVIQMILVITECRQPFVRRVIVHLQILADDPLAERFRDFSCLIIDETQKISGFGMLFIQLKTEAEHLCGAGQIS